MINLETTVVIITAAPRTKLFTSVYSSDSNKTVHQEFR